MKKLIIGCDHAAPELKAVVRDHLIARGFDVEDVGVDTAESCHYPIIAHTLCKKIQSGERDLGILICGTGVGMAIAANKHPGIRAACCSDTFSARMTREHNNANVLCFGARVVAANLAIELVNAFLDAQFQGGRHQIRVDMIAAIERDGTPS